MAQKKITDLDLISSLTDDCNFPVDNSVQTYRATVAQMNAYLKPNYQKANQLLKNIGLAVSANTGAMTVALKQADGATDPTSTDPNVSEVSFRSNTLNSGARNTVSFSAALSLVIPSTATMGYANGANALVYVYLYYDGSNKGLMVSTRFLNEDSLYSLALIGTGSDDDSLYADAVRTSAAIRLIGKFQVDAITTAGTWTTPTSIAVAPFSIPVKTPFLITKTNTDYTILDTDGYSTVLFSTGNTNRAATLPSAINNASRRLTIKKIDSGTGKVTVTGTIDGLSNFVLADMNDTVTVESDGAAWYIVSKGCSQNGKSAIKDVCGSATGYGSTNTMVRRIETNVFSNGNAITKAISSTAGNSYTINQRAMYWIQHGDRRTASAVARTLGLSINSAQLTTDIQTITEANRLSQSGSGATEVGNSNYCSWQGWLDVGDVIRPHGDSNMDGSDGRTFFEISKVCI